MFLPVSKLQSQHLSIDSVCGHVASRLDTEHCDLPTEVVPIYQLTFLHAFKLLDWQELGQATGAHSVTWIRSDDSGSSDLAAQRLSLTCSATTFHYLYWESPFKKKKNSIFPLPQVDEECILD